MKKRTYYIIFFSFVIALLGYGIAYQILEEDRIVSASVPSTELGIPEQAIRLRVLANSDQVEDQWVKRKVRDEVIREMNTWVKKPKSIIEARQSVKKHLSRFQQIAEQTLSRYGFTYSAKVDFGQVPFPTKLYGNFVYPAGKYEALRITLGKGEGANWWCVLFPPLCFIDMSNGDAVNKKDGETLSVASSNEKQAYAEGLENEEKEPEKSPVEVRFLLLDQIKKLVDSD